MNQLKKTILISFVRKTEIFIYLILVFLFFFSSKYKLSAQSPDSTQFEVNVTKTLLGTEIEAKAINPDINLSKKALYYAFKEIERIEDLFSTHKEYSIIKKINDSAGISPIKVTDETFSIIKRAIEYSKKYEGLFDITVGCLTELWGFSSDREIKVPSKEKIASLLPLVNYKNIILSEKDTTVFLPKKGMALDLGGIAKGYAVDRASNILKKYGITRYLINAGGDLVCSGFNSSNSNWSIGVKHPRLENDLIAKFQTKDIVVATSGDYERFIIVDSVRYHHILMPMTGMPGILSSSVTVFFNNCEEATVLGKYIFLIGVDKFLKLPISKELDYIIIDSNGKIFYSQSMKDKYNLELMK
jgi:FAD:protein FMN transferase